MLTLQLQMQAGKSAEEWDTRGQMIDIKGVGQFLQLPHYFIRKWGTYHISKYHAWHLLLFTVFGNFVSIFNTLFL